MIPDKTLEIPAFTRRSVRRKLALNGEESGAVSVRALHMRKDGEGLTVAEGCEKICTLPDGFSQAVSARGHGMRLFARGENALCDFKDGTEYTFPSAPRDVLCFLDENGEECYFAVTKDGVFALANGEARTVGADGGTCAAVHYERIFTADGCRISYSNPLAPEDWTGSVQGAGFVDLPSEGGDAVALVSFRERLYLFRGHGITRLRALGDTLSLKAETVPFVCGNILSGSVQNCGGYVLFFTENGLYSFNGTSCSLMDGCGASYIDLTMPLSSAVYDGNYACAVTLKGGERAIFCADPIQRTGYFLRYEAESLACGADGLYFACEGALCRLTPRGLPPLKECLVQTEYSLLGLSDADKYLDCVTVEGVGEFWVEAKAECGAPSYAHGRAGGRLRFSRPVHGNAFALTLRSHSENAYVAAVVYGVREGEAW